MNQRTYSLSGDLCDSIQESKVADWLYLNNIKFEIHKKLPKPSTQKCDFYLPDFGPLWVEWDGVREVRNLSSDFAMDRQQRKYEFYKQHDMRYVVLKRDNNWENRLYEAIFAS